MDLGKDCVRVWDIFWPRYSFSFFIYDSLWKVFARSSAYLLTICGLFLHSVATIRSIFFDKSNLSFLSRVRIEIRSEKIGHKFDIL